MIYSVCFCDNANRLSIEVNVLRAPQLNLVSYMNSNVKLNP
jgi:hypothetical protein